MAEGQVIAGLNQAQLWAIGAAVVAIAVGVIVSLVSAVRVRSSGSTQINESVGTLRATIDEHGVEQSQRLGELEIRLVSTINTLSKDVGQAQVRIQELEQRSHEAERGLRNVKLKAALQQAVIKGFKARTHLAEHNTGLAERDLTEVDAAIALALSLAPKELRPVISEIRQALVDLKRSVEARTFPVATVEMLTDRIDAVIESEALNGK